MRTTDQYSILDIVTAMQRHRIKVCVLAAAVVAAGFAFLIWGPKKYASQATLLVRLGRENARLDPAATVGDGEMVDITQDRRLETNSVAEMLGSRSLAEAVVDQMGPDAIIGEADTDRGMVGGAQDWLRQRFRGRDVSPRDAAVRKLQKGLKVEAIRDTNLVRIAYRSSDPDRAQSIVREVIDEYLQEHVRVHRSDGAYEFLKRQRQRLADQLADAERELVELRNRTGLVSPEEQTSVLVARIGALRSELHSVEASLAESRAEMEVLQAALEDLESNENADSSLVAASSSDANGMRTSLYQLQLEAQDALAKYGPDHVKVKLLRKQLEAGQSILAKQEVSLEIQKLRPTMAALQAKAETLRAQIAESESDLDALNANEMRIAQLERVIEVRDAAFRQVSTEAELAEIDHSLQQERITNISLVQTPSFDPYPVFPSAAMVLLGSGMLASLACVALVMWLEIRSMSRSVSRMARSNQVVQVAGDLVSPINEGAPANDRSESLGSPSNVPTSSRQSPASEAPATPQDEDASFVRST